MDKIYIIDGSGFIFRAFYALPPLTAPNGQAIGAVLGFCNMIIKTINDKKPARIVVAFDAKRKTFRNDIFPEYKANRKDTPEDLIGQFAIVRSACEAFSIPMIEIEGFEADDIIASICRIAVAKGISAEVISSDKDMMQLISDKVSFFDPAKSKIISEDDVLEKWGVRPSFIPDVQALLGDKSDNIPGIHGIGIKTAAELINRAGSLEALLHGAHEISSPRKRDMIINGADDARLSYQLALLRNNIEIDIEKFVYAAPNHNEAAAFLSQYGLMALQERMRASGILQSKHVETAIKNLLSVDQALIDEIRASGQVSLYFDKGTVYAYAKNQYLVQDSDSMTGVLSDPGILKILYNAKDLFHKYHIENFDDIMLMSYVLYGKTIDHEMENICLHVLAMPFNNTPALIKDIYDALLAELARAGTQNVYESIDKPLAPMLAKMEKAGISVDERRLMELSGKFETQLRVLEKSIYILVGTEFNIASAKQMGEVLFEQLSWHGGKKGKSGAYHTSSDVLEGFIENGTDAQSDIAAKILEWRTISKLKSTYSDSLIRQIDTDGRVHTHYKMTETSTGRLSSVNPNLQNIPIRSAYGKEIRACFVASKGNILISFDYSQIELRILAHIGPAPELQEAFIKGQNIHEKTALDVFSNNDSDSIRKAKIINFGILYGMSAFGLAKLLHISRDEAKEYIDKYFEHFKSVKEYIKRIEHEARANGFVTTFLGRRCFIPNINSKNCHIQEGAIRQAINAPLQGGSADIIKLAMPSVDKALNGTGAKLLLQIHDELIIECPQALVRDVTEEVTNIMENVTRLSVPLVVNSSYGESLL